MMAKLLFIFQKNANDSELIDAMRKLMALFGQHSDTLSNPDQASLFAEGSALDELCHTIASNFDAFWNSEIICVTIGMNTLDSLCVHS